LAKAKMLKIYSSAMAASAPLLNHLLRRRLARGKEDASRLAERMGKAAKPRPEGLLVWVHAASVGEAQSALILINSLLQSYKNLHVLVTTGTMTSAGMMARN